jgi:hypothetical protein
MAIRHLFAMRYLFLNKPTSRFTARQWLLTGLALGVIEAGVLAVYVMRPSDSGLSVDLASPHQQCVSRGIAQYDVRHEWPVTLDGRDARTAVESRCTLDLGSFE